MTVAVRGSIDLAGRYRLISGLPVLSRDDSTVQIGSEPPKCVVLHNAPANSVGILNRLNGGGTAAEILRAHDADPLLWTALLTKLRDADLLVAVSEWNFSGTTGEPFLHPERDSLALRYGVAAAGAIMQTRRDSVVVVRGSGRLAGAIALALAMSGIGHVHHEPDRALRLADLGRTAGVADPPDNGRALRMSRRGPNSDRPTRRDARLLADRLRLYVPGLSVHPPAPHHPAGLVILAGDGPPAPALAAELTDRKISHLVVQAGLSAVVVGPFVLPGRSSCLGCAMRRREAMDSGRPLVEAAMRNEVLVPPALLICAGSALAVGESLDHVDGRHRPTTLNGTIEWRLGEFAARRRSWTAHPACGCSHFPVSEDAPHQRTSEAEHDQFLRESPR